MSLGPLVVSSASAKPLRSRFLRRQEGLQLASQIIVQRLYGGGGGGWMLVVMLLLTKVVCHNCVQPGNDCHE